MWWRLRLGLMLFVVGGGWLVWPLVALANSGGPPFGMPYALPVDTPAAPLESYLVFSAPPRADVPDGQTHWTGLEVPGIDVLGPDGLLRNMCPDGGRAWSVAAGDPFGGEQFVAVECDGRAAGWQMLAFHLCKVRIRFSIDAANRDYNLIPAGGVLAEECPGGHTHLSLGYWAEPAAKQDLPCPQWYVQGRYWVNPACLAQAQVLPPAATFQLNISEDWELQYLTPEVLVPLRQWAFWGVVVVLSLYVLRGIFWKPAADEVNRRESPGLDALARTAIWVIFLILLILFSAGPIWPLRGGGLRPLLADDAAFQQFAQQVGYADWRLLKAFYLVAVPRRADGHPAAPDEVGKIFPPEAAAAIPFGETNTAAWGTADPTLSGPYGQFRAWDAVADRWPVSFYEQSVLGSAISLEAQRQRAGLQAMADNPAVQALGRSFGKTIRPQDLYGSSAGAVGRTQILPGHFAPGALCGDLASMDVWNDPVAIAECTTRYLTSNGCWGTWWNNGDVWSALCSYNPGAWNVAQDQWYWDVLQDRFTRLTAARAALPASANQADLVWVAPSHTTESQVSSPILGVLLAQALLQDGASPYQFPGPLNEWVRALSPALTPHRAVVHGFYRMFRAWTLIFYTPEQLAALGVQL